MAFLLTFDLQIFHSIPRGEDKDFNITVREHRCLFCLISVQRPSCDCGVTRSKSSLTSPNNFVKHALGRFDHTLICLTEDVAFLQTTGQRTGAFMEASESSASSSRVPQLVLVLAGIEAALVACIFEVSSSSDGSLTGCATACHRVGHRNTSYTLGVDLFKVCLKNSE